MRSLRLYAAMRDLQACVHLLRMQEKGRRYTSEHFQTRSRLEKGELDKS